MILETDELKRYECGLVENLKISHTENKRVRECK